MKDYKKAWRKRFREALVKSFGGKCGICGYNKCYEALDFHHLNPNEKDSELSKYLRNGCSWGTAEIEARKCVCLCSNCHREVHAQVTDIPKNIQRFDDSLIEEHEKPGYKKEIEYITCPQCQKKMHPNLKHCSVKCALEANRKVRFDKGDLEEKILVKKMSYEEIGRSIGVSGNAIKKRAKRLGINLPIRNPMK